MLRMTAWRMRPWQAGIGLIILAGFAIALRLHSLEEPLHTDLCIYACVGNQMLAGEKLYTDLVDNKPPGVYLVYMLAIWIGGYRAETILWLGAVFTIATLLLIFLTLQRLAGTMTALAGALAWTLISNCIHLCANQPNTETFINTFLMLGFWLLVRALQQRTTDLWQSGLAFAVASFFKTNVAFLLVVIGLFVFVYQLRQNSAHKVRDALYTTAQWAAPMVAFWACVFLFFLLTGRWDDFSDVFFKSLYRYSGNIWLNEWRFFTNLSLHANAFRHEVILLAILAVVLAGLKLFRPKTIWDGLMATYVFGIFLTIGSMARQLAYYYQLLLPPLTMIGTLALKELFESLKEHPSWRRAAVLAAGIIWLGGLAFYTGRYLLLSPQEISQKKFGDVMVTESFLGRMLGALSAPEDTIYQWGHAGILYFYSQRRPASGVVINHIFDFCPKDVEERLKNKIFNELGRARPAFIVFYEWIGNFQENMIFKSMHEQYRYFGSFDRMLIYVRKDHIYRLEAAKKWIALLTSKTRNKQPSKRLQLAGSISKKEILQKLSASVNRKLAVAAGNDRYAFLIQDGNCQAEHGRWAEARDIWLQAMTLYPEKRECLANLGIYHEHLGSYYLAMHHYQLAYDRLGPPWDEYNRLVQLKLIYQAEYMDGRVKTPPRYRRDLARVPGEDEYSRWVRQGNEEAGKGHWYKARDIWLKALQKYPAFPHAQANLGIFYEINQSYDQAIAAYYQAGLKLGEPWVSYYQEVIRMRNRSSDPEVKP